VCVWDGGREGREREKEREKAGRRETDQQKE
jgi:hypothetical protein